MHKIKVSVYTRSHHISPASYYRINQYIDKMKGENFEIVNHYAISDTLHKWYLSIKKENRTKQILSKIIVYIASYFSVLKSLIYDNFVSPPKTTIISRSLVPKIATPSIIFLLERLLQKTIVIWDFDDNIFENGEIDKLSAGLLTKYSHRIIVTSKFLREQLPQLPNDRFIYLPTTDGDMYNFYNNNVIINRLKRYEKEIAIIWVATAVNLPFLKEVIPYIDSAAKIIKEKGKNVILEIVCNQELEYKTNTLQIKNIRWSREIAINRMLEAHIGIMPLIENEYTKGKGGFKLIQYMSVGLPVIASNVGYNKEIITHNYNNGYLLKDFSEWTSAILRISDNISILQEMGKASRNLWEKEFSYKENFTTWIKLISGEL